MVDYKNVDLPTVFVVMLRSKSVIGFVGLLATSTMTSVSRGSKMLFEDYVKERHRIFNLQDANKECLNINWGTLSLNGEVGEFANIVKKINRDDGGIITDEKLYQMKDELGDVMWYWLFVCDILKLKPEEIMQFNMNKLKKRYGIE